jgi:hypothetical protein
MRRKRMERGNVVSFRKESGNGEGVRNVMVLYIFPLFVQYLRDIGEINKPMSFGSNVIYFPIRIGWGM